MRKETAAKIFLGALWLVCAYRAVTQSIVHDEALTYQSYLAVPPSRMFQTFDANNHFLSTLLMYVCVSLFGAAEWSMRLPALAGAALYFAAIYRICRYAFGAGYVFLLAIGLVTLNPFVLDFMVAARGYGMALALWMWALAVLLPYITDSKSRTPRKLAEAAVALALSVVANLIFAIPAAVLAGMVLWLLRKPAEPVGQKEDKKKARRKIAEEPSLITYFVLPIVGVAGLFILVSPVTSAEPAAFYAGVATIGESLRSLASVTFAHGAFWRTNPAVVWASDIAAFGLAPAILIAGVVVGARRRDFLLLLTAGVATGSGLCLLLAHLVIGMPYPMDRTGIYFLPLLALAGVGLAANIPSKPGATAAYAVLVALLLVFAAQWNVRKFIVWEYDTDTREIARRIAQNSAGKSPALVGATWQIEPALNFYRMTKGLTGMQPVTRAPITGAFDYYVVASWDRQAVEPLRLRPLYQGEVSGTMLAAPDVSKK